MIRRFIARFLPALGLLLLAGPASAHTGEHVWMGFASGLTHPASGLDHLLATLALGLWAGQQGGAAHWRVPLVFVASLLAGAALAAGGIALPHVEPALALSVLVPGLMIVAFRRLDPTLGWGLAAGFALIQGYAHGAEMPLAAFPISYGLGFVLATLALLGAGLATSRWGRRWTAAAGTGIAASGAVLLWLA
jgi:urease accessory protein